MPAFIDLELGSHARMGSVAGHARVTVLRYTRKLVKNAFPWPVVGAKTPLLWSKNAAAIGGSMNCRYVMVIFFSKKGLHKRLRMANYAH